MLLLLRWLINAVILYLISQYLPGFHLATFYTALIVVLVFGLINAILGTILKLLTFPINILTLGIFALLINGALLYFTSTLIKGFTVTGFWVAFVAALIYSLGTALVNVLLKRD